MRRADGKGIYFHKVNGAWQTDVDLGMSLTQGGDAAITLTLRDGTVERYASSGNISSITDPTGRRTSFGESGLVINSITGPFGHTLTFGISSGRIATITDPDQKVITYSYDASNNLSRVDYPDNTARIYHYENTSFPNYLTGISYADSAGVITRYSTYAYNSIGKAISTRHAETGNGAPQEEFTFNYDNYYTNSQTTVTSAPGSPVAVPEVMTFAATLGVQNLVSKVNSIDGKSLNQAFDSNGNLICKKDEENRVTTYTYNTSNQRTGMTEGLTGDCANPANVPGVTRTTTYAYLSPTLDLPRFIRRPSVASGQTFETELVYGDPGHPNLPTQIIQRGYTPTGNSISRSVTLGYNAFGQVNVINGPRTDVNDVTTLEYYECTTGGGCGQLMRVTNALGHITTYDQYDANGRLLQMTDPNGLVTTYSYDPRGRVKTITRMPASGSAATTQYSYTPWGDVSQVIDPDGVVLNYQYDAAQNLRFIVDAAGNYIHYQYDLKGNRTGEDIYDAGGNLKRTLGFAYDLRNQLKEISNAGNITQLVHDAVGNLTRETDPNNNPATRHTPDALNRLVQTIDRLGGTTAYGYDVNDRPTQVTPPDKSATQYVYDDLGNLLQEVSPDRNATNYTYDAAGNLKTMLTARNHSFTYTYDALNRLTFADAPVTANDATYVYDVCANGIGRLCSVNNAASTTSYGYDGLGNIIRHQSLAYTYTPAGRLSTVTYPSGAIAGYLYNTAGQVRRVRLTRNGTTQVIATGIQYAPFGPLTTMTYGNGKTLSQAWDAAYRLSAQDIPGVLDLDYPQYDGNDNLLSRLDALASQWSNFAYDPLDRLDTATGGFGNRDYDYDDNGNRTRLAEGTVVTNYVYATNTNRMTGAGSGSVTLDASGNITAQGNRTYTYNALNRLVRAYEGGNQIGFYAYNALGQRISKQAGGVTTSYAYGLDGLLRVETASNAAPREYVYLDGQPLAVMDQAPGTTMAVTTVPALKNSNVSITWNGITAPTTGDWIGIYTVGSNDFAYMDWAYTNGGANGTVSVTLNHPGLVAGGTYEARLYANDGYTLLAKSAPFVLSPTGPVVAVTSAPAVKNSSITVKWSGVTAPATWDWVGIYVPGSPDDNYLDWAYTNGGTSGTINVTLNHPGIVAGNTYEARLYANDGYTLIAKTPPFTVVANTGQSTPAKLYYYHNDHLGTPQAMTDSSGTVVWRAAHDPFGWATVDEDPDGDGNLVKNNKRYAGQYFDAETGLHYNWHRYYDPRIGRYISSDPIGLDGGLNTYLYARANPLKYIDTSGLDTILVCRPLGIFGHWPLTQINKPLLHCGVIVTQRKSDSCGGHQTDIAAQFSLPGLTRRFTTDTNNETFIADRNAFINPGSRDQIYNIPPPPGQSQAEFDANVISHGNAYSQPPYGLVQGPNSNSAAFEIIRQAGGAPPNVPAAPGSGIFEQRY